MKPVFDSFDEPVVDRRKFIVGVTFAGAAGLAAWRTPRRHLDFLGGDKLDRLVPNKIGRWDFVASSGLVVPPKDQLQEAIYSQLLTRVYSDDQSPPIMLLLAQSAGETGFLQIHRPEICYSAGGYQILSVQPHQIKFQDKLVNASSVVAAADGRTEHIIYWTRVGTKMPLNWAQQRLAVAEQNLQGIIPDAILVRASCVSSDAAEARANIDQFFETMLSSIPPSRQSVFIA